MTPVKGLENVVAESWYIDLEVIELSEYGDLFYEQKSDKSTVWL